MTTPHRTQHDSVAFGRVPYDVMGSGVLAVMSVSQVKVYLALAAHTGRDWSASPSVERLAKMTGYSARQVQRAIKRLAERRLIEVAPGGGRSRRNRYRLTINPDAVDVTVYTKTPTPRVSPFTPPKPRHPEAKRVTFSTLKGDTQDVRLTEEQKEQSSSSGCAAASPAAAADRVDPSAEVMAVLAAAGIGDPTRSRLARQPGVTVELVREAVEHCDERGKGTGVLVREIEARADQITGGNPTSMNHDSDAATGGLMACDAVDEDDPRLGPAMNECQQSPTQTIYDLGKANSADPNSPLTSRSGTP